MARQLRAHVREKRKLWPELETHVQAPDRPGKAKVYSPRGPRHPRILTPHTPLIGAAPQEERGLGTDQHLFLLAPRPESRATNFLILPGNWMLMVSLVPLCLAPLPPLFSF